MTPTLIPPSLIPPARMTPSLMVGTPAYGGMVHLDYLNALFGFTAHGIAFQLAAIGNESLITRARNTILSNFHASPQCSHLLFLDADVNLPAAGLRRMLDADVPVIGAPVALKGTDAAGQRLWNTGPALGSRGRLIEVGRVGSAALLLSRAAVQALVDDAIADGRVYSPAPNLEQALGQDRHYDVFRVGVKDGVYLSEDYWVCERLRALGFPVLIDPSIVTTHHGIVDV